MTHPDDAPVLPTPGAIVVAIAAFLAGALSLAFNPLFALSVVAVLLGSVTLRWASRPSNYVIVGLLRIIGVLAIMGGAGGAVALAFPGLGVR